MRKIFEPAVRLMDRLGYPRKFALMAIVISLPVLAFLFLLISEINRDVSFAKKERLGVRFNHAVMKFFQDLQQHRGMAAAFIEGDASFREKILERQSHIANDIRAIDALNNEYGKAIGITGEWSLIKEKWDALGARVFSMLSARESFDMHTELINDTLSLMVRIADISNLTLDPEIDSFYLMDTVVNKLPAAAEYAGQLRGLGMSVIMLPGDITTGEKTHLIVLSGLCKSAVVKITESMEKVFRTNPGLKQMIETHLTHNNASIYHALEILESRVINPAKAHIGPEEYFDVFTKAGNSIFTLHLSVSAALEGVLQNRIDGLTGKRSLIGAFAALMLLIMAYLFAGSYLSVMDSLSNLMNALKRMGSGEMNTVVSLKTRDEMKLVADSFNEMAKKLTGVMEELKRSNEELEHFAYLASHDLKTPLLTVGSNLKLFHRRYAEKLNEEADRFIADAIKSTIRMEKLISDILAYSRVGTHGNPFGPVDCSEALSISLENLKIDVERSGAEITHDSLPAATGDPVQLVQLFQNLIGNALKFRGEEKPHIHLSAERKGKEWVFSVRDNGIGIPEEQTKKVFEIFHRYHGEKYPGTGIGLATCKKIVERHGGRIWVESEPGRGSTFYFTLPATDKRNGEAA
ncbi:MAG: HAMP domain-containing protein [Nitrospiraceae bacterium]|nr:MAG: HAMP domain-containing protein [Nitrospiraceae bacterium]